MRVLLLDASDLAERSFQSLPDLRTGAGEPTSAAFGVARALKKLLAQRSFEAGAAVFDGRPGAGARPGDLARQIPWIERLAAASGLPVLRQARASAAAVVAAVARDALARGDEVLVASSDKRLAALVGPRLRLFDPVREVTYDPELVRKRWGVEPEQLTALLALAGDKTAGIRGVPGIGAKGAAQLLGAWGSLEAALEHRDELPTRARKALGEHPDALRRALEEATVVPVEPAPRLGDLALRAPDAAALDALYRELEMHSLLERAPAAAAAERADLDVEALLDPAAVRALLAELAAAGGPVVLHGSFEAPEPDPSPLVGLTLALARRARYLPLRAPDVARDLAAPEWAFLRGWLEDAAAPKVGHDLRALWVGLRRHGVTLAGASFDTRLASFLVDPTGAIPHRLEQVTRHYLQEALPERKALTGGGASPAAWSEVALAEAARHAGREAVAVAALEPLLAARLEEVGLAGHLRERELPLSWILGQMELVGIGVDAEDVGSLGEEFRERLAGYEARIHALAGRPFNVNSTKQLSAVLFEELGLPVVKRTKTGYSTSVDVLERLATDHEIARVLLEHRKLAKLISTYTDVLLREVDPATGRIHAVFQQTASTTGRLITTRPDLQRTPVATPEGERIRRAFVAPEGRGLVSGDWHQLELRLLAHLSRDPHLVAVFREGVDVHRTTAAELFGGAPADVTPEQRRVAKAVNFATLYGQGPTALGRTLGLPRREAQGFIDRFFAAFPGVRRWLDEAVAAARERGYATTVLGRRRFIPELTSRDPMVQQAGERVAANTPLQGSAADICKLVMLALPERLAAAGLTGELVLQVHDELVLEVPAAELEPTATLLREVMEGAWPLDVPLTAGVGAGRSWAEAHHSA